MFMKLYKSYSLLLFLLITGFVKAADNNNNNNNNNNNRQKATLILLTAQASCLTLCAIGLGLETLEKNSGNNMLSQELINYSKNMFAWTLLFDCSKELLDLIERLLPN